MSPQQIRVFLECCRLGSFSKAATALYLTPSAVIQSINALEKNLSVSLFTRTAQGITLTAAGHYLADAARTLLDQENEIRSTLSRYSDNAVTIGSGFTRKTLILPELLRQYRQTQELSVHVTEVINPINEYASVDIIESVNYGANWQQLMDFTPLCEVPTGLAVPKSLPLANKDRLSVEDLKDLTIIVSPRSAVRPAPNGLIVQFKNAGATVLPMRERFNTSVVGDCLIHQYCMMMPSCWIVQCPDFKFMQLPYESYSSYGLFMNTNAGSAVRAFMHFVQTFSDDSVISGLVPECIPRSSFAL